MIFKMCSIFSFTAIRHAIKSCGNFNVKFRDRENEKEEEEINNRAKFTYCKCINAQQASFQCDNVCKRRPREKVKKINKNNVIANLNKNENEKNLNERNNI